MDNYIYESKKVNKGRKSKICASCNKFIEIGEPSITLTCFNGEFYAEDLCSEECKVKFEIDFENGTE